MQSMCDAAVGSSVGSSLVRYSLTSELAKLYSMDRLYSRITAHDLATLQ